MTDSVCFVVGPIGAEDSDERLNADWLLDGIIEPVFLREFPNFRVERADRIATPGLIDAQIILRLIDSELVIADLSTLNPNVFYEIGIRHMAQKPIIHMFPKGLKPPFDISLQRSIEFSRRTMGDLAIAQKRLTAQVKETLAEGFQVENPVTNARGRLQALLLRLATLPA